MVLLFGGFMFRVIFIGFSLFLSSFHVQAFTTRDLNTFEYEVRFTNPKCSEYYYVNPVYSFQGERLNKKPDSYCNHSDARKAGRLKSSPLYKVNQWVKSEDTRDITLLTFSLSNTSFIRALCGAAQKDIEVTIRLDEGTDPQRTRDLIRQMRRCHKNGKKIDIETRGGTGGLGIHHNKLLMINRKGSGPMKLAYGSANFSSGLVLHHENWSFVTIQKDSFFAQTHECMVEGVDKYAGGAKSFKDYINKCKSSIKYPKESDIELFIAPAEARESMQKITAAINKSQAVDLAAHRFSARPLLEALHDLIDRNGSLRMTFDDDMFWAAKSGRGFGNQDANEARIVRKFLARDISPFYLETEHRQHLLHHNKYLLFKDQNKRPFALHTGAGNLTNAAFSRNFENFYFITRSDILKKFETQYNYVVQNLATQAEDMPTVSEPEIETRR